MNTRPGMSVVVVTSPRPDRDVPGVHRRPGVGPERSRVQRGVRRPVGRRRSDRPSRRTRPGTARSRRDVRRRARSRRCWRSRRRTAPGRAPAHAWRSRRSRGAVGRCAEHRYPFEPVDHRRQAPAASVSVISPGFQITMSAAGTPGCAGADRRDDPSGSARPSARTRRRASAAGSGSRPPRSGRRRSSATRWPPGTRVVPLHVASGLPVLGYRSALPEASAGVAAPPSARTHTRRQKVRRRSTFGRSFQGPADACAWRSA